MWRGEERKTQRLLKDQSLAAGDAGAKKEESLLAGLKQG